MFQYTKQQTPQTKLYKIRNSEGSFDDTNERCHTKQQANVEGRSIMSQCKGACCQVQGPESNPGTQTVEGEN